MKNIKISQILKDLSSGLSRSPKSNGYNSNVGSIQEKYELNEKELKALFQHEKLKGKKRGQQTVNIMIEDDTEESSEDSTVPNNSGLSPELFETPWRGLTQEARELAKTTTNTQED